MYSVCVGRDRALILRTENEPLCVLPSYCQQQLLPATRVRGWSVRITPAPPSLPPSPFLCQMPVCGANPTINRRTVLVCCVHYSQSPPLPSPPSPPTVCSLLLPMLHESPPPPPPVVWGECNHSFHNCCMKQWIMQNNRCPLCQQEWIVQRFGS